MTAPGRTVPAPVPEAEMMGVKKDHESRAMNPTARRFARALSVVLARHMTACGMDRVYDVVKRVPAEAALAPMTVYSQLYGRARPNLWVLLHVAGVLGVTLDRLCDEARREMAAPEKGKTVRQVFRDASPAGRPTKRRSR